MKVRYIIPLLVAAALFPGCSPEPAPQKKTAAGFRAGAPTAPVAALLKAVGEPFVAVSTALPANRSAHEYELSARETAALAGCRFYVTLDLPFERHLPAMMKKARLLAPLKDGILPVLLKSEGEHDGKAVDPHVFLHPENNIALANAVAEAFAELDPAHRAEYAGNAASFTAQQKALQQEIAAELAPFKGRKFYVQHPAFAYFGAAYGLTQVPLEKHASGTSAKELAECIREAKQAHVRGILIQKESNAAPAQVVARAIGARLIEVDPLSSDLPGTQKKIAAAIKESLQ